MSIRNKTMPTPQPMAGKGQPVDWMFAFKFNAQLFPGCTEEGKVRPLALRGFLEGRAFLCHQNPTLRDSLASLLKGSSTANEPSA